MKFSIVGFWIAKRVKGATSLQGASIFYLFPVHYCEDAGATPALLPEGEVSLDKPPVPLV